MNNNEKAYTLMHNLRKAFVKSRERYIYFFFFWAVRPFCAPWHVYTLFPVRALYTEPPAPGRMRYAYKYLF